MLATSNIYAYVCTLKFISLWLLYSICVYNTYLRWFLPTFYTGVQIIALCAFLLQVFPIGKSNAAVQKLRLVKCPFALQSIVVLKPLTITRIINVSMCFTFSNAPISQIFIKAFLFSWNANRLYNLFCQD